MDLGVPCNFYEVFSSSMSASCHSSPTACQRSTGISTKEMHVCHYQCHAAVHIFMDYGRESKGGCGSMRTVNVHAVSGAVQASVVSGTQQPLYLFDFIRLYWCIRTKPSCYQRQTE